MGRSGLRCCIAGLLCASGVAAQPSVPDPTVADGMQIEYAAPKGCGEEGAFLERLRKRAPDYGEVRAGEGARRLVIVIRQSAVGFAGSLRLEVARPQAEVREIEAARCSELLDALALMAALALNPKGQRSLASDTESPAAPASPPSAAASSSARSPAPPQPLSRPGLEVRGVGRSLASSSHRPDSSSNSSRELSVGAGALGSVGVGPGTLFGGEFFASARFRTVSRGIAAWSYSPSFRVGLRRLWGAALETSKGRAQFGLTAAVLEVCPLGWSAGNRGFLSTCILSTWGLLAATGANTQAPTSIQAFWGAVGMELRGGLRLSRRIEIEGGFSGELPVRRDRFLFGDWLFHRTGPVIWSPSVALVACFP